MIFPSNFLIFTIQFHPPYFLITILANYCHLIIPECLFIIFNCEHRALATLGIVFYDFIQFPYIYDLILYNFYLIIIIYFIMLNLFILYHLE